MVGCTSKFGNFQWVILMLVIESGGEREKMQIFPWVADEPGEFFPRTIS